ncbi:UNVERIFIED_CONTAM: hypothetical protein K2H54_004658 [Gekko kuhli]
MHVPVSVEECVAVAMWWMANTMSYRVIGHQFGLACSTMAGIMVEVTLAMKQELLNRVVYLRNPDRARAGEAELVDQEPEVSARLRGVIVLPGTVSPSPAQDSHWNAEKQRQKLRALEAEDCLSPLAKQDRCWEMVFPKKGVPWLQEEVECLLWTLHDLEARQQLDVAAPRAIAGVAMVISSAPESGTAKHHDYSLTFIQRGMSQLRAMLIRMWLDDALAYQQREAKD